MYRMVYSGRYTQCPWSSKWWNPELSPWHWHLYTARNSNEDATQEKGVFLGGSTGVVPIAKCCRVKGISYKMGRFRLKAMRR